MRQGKLLTCGLFIVAVLATQSVAWGQYRIGDF